jgi:hypothetical protein
VDYFAFPGRSFKNLNFPTHLFQMMYCGEKSSILSKNIWADYTGFSVLMAELFGQENEFSNFHTTSSENTK